MISEITEVSSLIPEIIPEIAGVSSPSTIIIQVPRRTTVSEAVCKNLSLW